VDDANLVFHSKSLHLSDAFYIFLCYSWNQAVGWIPKVSHEDREDLETEARQFYSESYPDIVYNGIMGFEPDPALESGTSIQNRSEQPFYYPVHFVEPIERSSTAIELDLYSSTSRRESIELALSTHQPAAAASKPFQTLQESSSASQNIILLFNPGIKLSNYSDMEPRDLALLVINLEELVSRATTTLQESLRVYLYDSTDANAEPVFLIAADLQTRDGENGETRIVFLDEIAKSDVTTDSFLNRESKVQMASVQWTIVAVAMKGTYEPDVVPSVVGSIFIMVASLFMALWIFSDMKRMRTMNSLKRQNEAEKSAMVLGSAKEAAKLEEELNDYIAHEVRNPLSAAMSALTFVKSSMIEKTTVNVNDIEDDVRIVDSSLYFINDLLRSMLDFHRVKSRKIKITKKPMDLAKDLLQPVTAMLYTRDLDIDILIDCPEGLIIETDPLRMKQIVLNLGRSATKYLQKGYIKLSVKVEDGTVKVIVEDSGPGIPVDKRKHLFSKFQESLDALNQGTGIGLCLCKNMVDLLDGEIYLDESFDSGVEGFPGTRFVFDTNTAPMTRDDIEAFINNKDEEISTSLRFMLEKELEEAESRGKNEELPETFSVLFVDDDLVLRKLFTRSVRKLAKTWNVQEAASGEIAMKMVEDQNFDLIFIDQYMASVEKQMLGTETTRALRAKGVLSRICGLSANDVEIGFFKAGADFFMLKPFPCQADELRRELLRIIYFERNPALADSLGGMQTEEAVTC
jgi:signal transduction histidine kinase